MVLLAVLGSTALLLIVSAQDGRTEELTLKQKLGKFSSVGPNR